MGSWGMWVLPGASQAAAEPHLPAGQNQQILDVRVGPGGLHCLRTLSPRRGTSPGAKSLQKLLAVWLSPWSCACGHVENAEGL